MIIDLPENLNEDYRRYSRLVKEIYNDCIDSGYEKGGAAGKTKYELEPMARSKESKKLLYLELSYYFAEIDLKESFKIAYDELRDLMNSRSLLELTAQLDISEQNKLTINKKARIIIKYYQENSFGDDRSTA